MKNLKEYSKLILSLMITLWFIVAIYGAIVVAIELAATLIYANEYSMATTVHLPELLEYVGEPMTAGIIGYLIKSALENREKIKKNDKSAAPIVNENPDEP